MKKMIYFENYFFKRKFEKSKSSQDLLNGYKKFLGESQSSILKSKKKINF